MSSSLGEALGLGHQLYVGFDKHAVRLIGALVGLPFALTLAVALTLAHALALVLACPCPRPEVSDILA